MILFLDEKKTVGTATGMLTSQEYCLKWKSGVQNILNHGQMIVLAGFGNITEPRVAERFFHTFEKHDTYFDNGRSMDFSVFVTIEVIVFQLFRIGANSL